MGWLISYNLTKKEQVAELVKGWSNEKGGCRFLTHSVRGNVLYAVGQNFTRTSPERFEDRFILVCLLRKDRGMGWGYKEMCERMGPMESNCPIKFLDMAPVADPKWRERVHATHEKRRKAAKKIEPGMVFVFADGFRDSLGDSLNGVESKIIGKSGRCYIAELGHSRIRIQRRHVGTILFTTEQAA